MLMPRRLSLSWSKIPSPQKQSLGRRLDLLPLVAHGKEQRLQTISERAAGRALAPMTGAVGQPQPHSSCLKMPVHQEGHHHQELHQGSTSTDLGSGKASVSAVQIPGFSWRSLYLPPVCLMLSVEAGEPLLHHQGLRYHPVGQRDMAALPGLAEPDLSRNHVTI